MLASIITLNVDPANNATIVPEAYSRHDDSQPNRTRYISPSHTLLGRDVLDFYRTPPKKAGNFNGVAKSGFKFTTDAVVPAADGVSTVVSPLIGEVSFSLPLGFTTAQVKKLRQRIIAALDDDALMLSLNEKQEV